jgi:hypothetical protein
MAGNLGGMLNNYPLFLEYDWSILIGSYNKRGNNPRHKSQAPAKSRVFRTEDKTKGQVSNLSNANINTDQDEEIQESI